METFDRDPNDGDPMICLAGLDEADEADGDGEDPDLDEDDVAALLDDEREEEVIDPA